jgi:hypothetical protein
MKIVKSLKLIKKLYAMEYGRVGGYGHIVFDDGNIEDGAIKHCINDAKESKYKKDISEYMPEDVRLASLEALEMFLKLTLKQRKIVYKLFWL